MLASGGNNMTTEIVIGIDGGGTYTRALAADLSGHVLASVETKAASPNKTSEAQENVQQAIREVVARSGRRLEDVVGLVAGLAGLDSPQDREWAEQFTAMHSDGRTERISHACQ
jgi:glucosamine kinase